MMCGRAAWVRLVTYGKPPWQPSPTEVPMRLIGLAVVLAVSLTIAPPATEAQQSARVYRLGFLSMRSGPTDNPQLDAFRQGLRELGYLEGRNVVLEVRYAAGSEEKLPGLAAELVRLNVDVIVAQSGGASTAAKNAPKTIPIVMASSGDAGRQGLVAIPD